MIREHKRQRQVKALRYPQESVTHIVLENMEDTNLQILDKFNTRSQEIDMNAELRRLQGILETQSYKSLEQVDKRRSGKALHFCHKDVLHNSRIHVKRQRV